MAAMAATAATAHSYRDQRPSAVRALAEEEAMAGTAARESHWSRESAPPSGLRYPTAVAAGRAVAAAPVFSTLAPILSLPVRRKRPAARAGAAAMAAGQLGPLPLE